MNKKIEFLTSLVFVAIFFLGACGEEEEITDNDSLDSDIAVMQDHAQVSDTDSGIQDSTEDVLSTDNDSVLVVAIEHTFYHAFNTQREMEGTLYQTVADTAELHALFPNIDEELVTTGIDFTNNLVVALSMGQKSTTGCYDITIDSVTATPSTLNFDFTLLSPTENCNCSAALSSPLTLIVINKTVLENQFDGNYDIKYLPHEKIDCLTD